MSDEFSPNIKDKQNL
jgi:hypothetical protein